jgi:hypothetical protein
VRLPTTFEKENARAPQSKKNASAGYGQDDLLKLMRTGEPGDGAVKTEKEEQQNPDRNKNPHHQERLPYVLVYNYGKEGVSDDGAEGNGQHHIRQAKGACGKASVQKDPSGFFETHERHTTRNALCAAFQHAKNHPLAPGPASLGTKTNGSKGTGFSLYPERGAHVKLIYPGHSPVFSQKTALPLRQTRNSNALSDPPQINWSFGGRS